MSTPTPHSRPRVSSRELVSPLRFVTRNPLFVLALALLVPMTGSAQSAPSPAAPAAPPAPAVAPGTQTFNTVITKLKAGKQVFSNTVLETYLEAA